MTEENLNRWQFNRVVNLSVLVQLVFLGSLIIGSWVNLQRQLRNVEKAVAQGVAQ